MNKSAILVSCLIGLVTGVVVVMLLRIPNVNLCCCADPAVLVFGTLLGAVLGPMFYRVVPSTKLNLGLGAVHGITVSAFAVFTVWLIISIFTSAETITDIAGQYADTVEEQFEEMKKEFEKQEGASQEDIEEQFDQLRDQFKLIRSEAGYARWSIIVMMVGHTFLIAPLLGLLGAWLGLSIFRSRIERRGGDTGGGDSDQMEPPEQQKPWWEESK